MRLGQVGFLQFKRKRDLPWASRRSAKIRAEEIEVLRLLEQIQRSMHRLDNAISELESVLWASRILKVQQPPNNSPIGIS
jgi:hypothetical protein